MKQDPLQRNGKTDTVFSNIDTVLTNQSGGGILMAREVISLRIPKIQVCKSEHVLRTQTPLNREIIIQNRYSSGIIIVLSGHLEFLFENGCVPCKASQAVWVPRGESYRILCHQAAESLVINFHAVEQTPPPSLLGSIDPSKAEALFGQLSMLLLKAKENYYRLMAVYYELLGAFEEGMVAVDTSERHVMDAEALILAQLSHPQLSCAGIAKQLNLSEVYLRKLFVRYRRMPISKYLLKTRMTHAQRLILEGYSISATAQEVGYCDIYQFSRAYKNYFGFSPSKQIRK